MITLQTFIKYLFSYSNVTIKKGLFQILREVVCFSCEIIVSLHLYRHSFADTRLLTLTSADTDTTLAQERMISQLKHTIDLFLTTLKEIFNPGKKEEIFNRRKYCVFKT